MVIEEEDDESYHFQGSRLNHNHKMKVIELDTTENSSANLQSYLAKNAGFKQTLEEPPNLVIGESQMLSQKGTQLILDGGVLDTKGSEM